MDEDLRWLEELGIDIQTGIAYTGSRDKYILALSRFYAGFEKNSERIEKELADSDTEAYMITVHALKSNAGMIGALELSAVFEKQETAAKKGDTDSCMAGKDAMMKAYKSLHDGLKPIGRVKMVMLTEEMSADEAKEYAGQALEALEDFDDELAKNLIGKLSGYPFRMRHAGLLKEAEALVSDFMYDEAADIIRQIIKEIDRD